MIVKGDYCSDFTATSREAEVADGASWLALGGPIALRGLLPPMSS
jgi:hypothetical protein